MKSFQKLATLVALVLLTLPCAAQNAFSVKTTTLRVPVLVKKANNPVVELEFPDATAGAALEEIRISLTGTTSLSDIKAVRIFLVPKAGDRSTNVQFGRDLAPKAMLTFTGTAIVKAGGGAWVSVELNDRARITNSLMVAFAGARINNRPVGGTLTQPSKLAMGVAVRQNGEENVHTYRIPGLTTTNKGTLLAVYDVRRDNNKDVQGNIDVGLSRSTDGGKTWEPMKIVLDRGKWGGLPEKFNGVSDANILVDKTDNTVHVFGLWMHGVLDKSGRFMEGLSEASEAWEHQWKDKGSQPGFGEKETSQVIYTTSKDDGKTWSDPVNVTEMFKKKEWWLGTIAPGHGITLTDGTLVIPTQGRDETGHPFSNITWSKDKGKTWHFSNPAYSNTTENMAVQLADGSIMLNMRHNDNRGNTLKNGRAIAVTRDLGETWTEHATSRNTLTEPTCMASLHKHEYTENGLKKSVLLFSNPNSAKGRDHITIKVSFDEGLTWPEKYWTLLDEEISRGYSCLTSIDENTIGILYEGSQASMTFQKFPLSTLIKR